MAKLTPAAPAPKKKKDILTPVILGVGAAGMGLGLFLFMKKPAGASPGDKFTARFEVDYAGQPDLPYIVQIALGTKWPGVPIFDREENLLWEAEFQVTDATHYTWDLICELPDTTPDRIYDAEALIRTPEMGDREYLIKVISEDVIKVLKE